MFLAIPHYLVLAFLLARIPGHHRDGRVRHCVHRPLSADTVRLQCRRAALELAGRVLRLRRPGHRPLPAVHLGPGRLPGRYRGRLPRPSFPRPGAGQVAAGRPAPDLRRPHRLHHPPVLVDRVRLVLRPPADRRLLGPQPARRHRRLLPVDHRALPPRHVRPARRHQPLALPRPHLPRLHARRVPALPSRPGPVRARRRGSPPAPAPRQPVAPPAICRTSDDHPESDETADSATGLAGPGRPGGAQRHPPDRRDAAASSTRRWPPS